LKIKFTRNSDASILKKIGRCSWDENVIISFEVRLKVSFCSSAALISHNQRRKTFSRLKKIITQFLNTTKARMFAWMYSLVLMYGEEIPSHPSAARTKNSRNVDSALLLRHFRNYEMNHFSMFSLYSSFLKQLFALLTWRLNYTKIFAFLLTNVRVWKLFSGLHHKLFITTQRSAGENLSKRNH
jgi:hypothetical protein